ncbi:M16 family metallopeptidase [Paraliomyxa miuraensis]|uniref:M16 family metallopeptidase n=1 Tax=Paraliomyxa miuraensis TaxID=376150 RepID=UPI0022513064|nr:pitrilysin family protein [Paraliomyxa miuraensis]MCX4247642.1 insulinase family protein [Paraliomyxa miuraensis]
MLGGLLACSIACNPTGETVTPGPKPGPSPTPTETAPAQGRRWPAPPPPTAPKPVRFPDVASFQLPTGLTVYIIENHEVPIVSAQLVVRCGTMDDEFLAAFAARMLGQGTQSRTKAKLDEAIEFVGGSLGAFAGTHVSTVFAHSLASDLKLALLLMADEVQNPVFPPAALDKVKQEAKAELRNQMAQPGVLADTLFNQVVYPEGHPYGRPAPTEASIDAIGLPDVRRFHSTFYRANNAFLLLSGDITAEQARPLVERAFGTWATAELRDLPPNPLNRFTRYTLPSELVVHVVDRPDATQSTIRVGNLALARNHEDWAALAVANQLLGGGPNARLFQDLREDRSLTYGIYSHVEPGQAPGTFVIETQTRTPTTGAMLAGIFGHIARIRTEDPQRIEFENTVRELVGSFPLQVETADQIVGKVNEQLVYGLPRDYWRTYRDGLAQVELSEVRKAAQQYIHALPVVVVVGNAAEVRPQIQEVLPTAKVIEYDGQLRKK